MSKGQGHEELRARIQQIDPYDFEHFVADLWEIQGWETRVSEKSNDRGVDVVAERDGVVSERHAIQAKRYTDGNKVGRNEIQQYYSLKVQDDVADAAIVVTSSSFTSNAKVWAYENNVKLVDGQDLTDLLLKHECEYLIDDYLTEGWNATTDETVSSTTETRDSSVEGDTPIDSRKSSLAWAPVVILASGTWAIATTIFFIGPSDGSGEWVSVLSFMLAFLSWLFIPVSLFLDAHELHRQEANYRPNRALWPIFGFLFAGIAVVVYLVRRFSKIITME